MSGFPEIDVDRLADAIAARLADRSAPPVHDRGPVAVKVAAYLLAHPGAPKRVVGAEVRGRRADVLWAWEAIRDAVELFPSDGNSMSGSEADAA